MISDRNQTAVTIDDRRSARALLNWRHSMNIRDWPKDLEVEGWSESLCLRLKESVEHILCVAEMTVMLAGMAGIPESEITYVRYGALLHDIGKIGIPDSILLKPGKLSADERAIVQKHPSYAYDLLYPIEYLRPCLSIPYAHHEKWDGTGYPQKLMGEQIPLEARLFAIADVWDALSFNRIYRKAWPQDKVIAFIQRQSGAHFDPMAVELFLRVVNK